jgi:excisionase family DNA binding protein
MDRLTIPRAAKRLPFSESALRRMVVSGRVLGVKVGRDWLIDAEEVDKLIDQYPESRRRPPVAVKVRIRTDEESAADRV